MRKRFLIRSAALTLLALVVVPPLFAGPKQEKKVREARWVYEQLFGNKQRKIPVALLADTRCIAVFPGVVEAAAVVKGESSEAAIFRPHVQVVPAHHGRGPSAVRVQVPDACGKNED